MLLQSRSKQRTKNFFISESSQLEKEHHRSSLTDYSSGFQHTPSLDTVSDYNMSIPSHRLLLMKEQKRMKSKSHMYNYDQVQLLTDKRFFKDAA